MTENPTEQLLPEQGDVLEAGDVQEDQEPELSGVDLAKVALQAARESARRRGAEPGAKRQLKARQGRGPVGSGGREPVGLGGALRGLMASRAWETPVAGGSVLDQWLAIAPELVGRAVAVAHDPESGRLDLRPSSSAWAVQLRLHAADLVARIGQHVGPGVVRTIRVLPPGSTPVPAPVATATAAAVPEPAEPREHSAGYQLALEAHRATKTSSTASPVVRAAIQRQDQALADHREPEEAFTAALEERERLEADRHRDADVQRRALRRARQERAAKAAGQLPSIAPPSSQLSSESLGRTA